MVTVQLSPSEAITITPQAGRVKITFRSTFMMFDRLLTVDQANAVGFGLEQAHTELDIQREQAENAAQRARHA